MLSNSTDAHVSSGEFIVLFGMIELWHANILVVGSSLLHPSVVLPPQAMASPSRDVHLASHAHLGFK